ncbi:hypothetical protein ID852_17980 [Xenorhabdus sp. 42]|uniref:hypothetical protein n=1 Tax=Xenorhabdus szentirmaii TaxID=290112 RepID=UPI0019A2733D|nr:MULTISPECIES: hypothetical protein [unclassified Xenorhabdus]MBD2794343.1 hypothetical protein [Xenorhabdus sp. CUL]MBD2804786.1 hypothetical protein [Xenorhabdus sp. ZM]MBD2822531.1 hypothetical protein [Xenorhabdus sp. 42]MBD2826629.1 hypothetical protein [Xenorhabdus sp. 5]
MKLPCLNKNNVQITRIDYDSDTKKIIFYFLHASEEKILSAIVNNEEGKVKFISAIDESDELFNFLMSLMIIDSQVTKNFNRVAWNYIEGREVIFPVQLIS